MKRIQTGHLRAALLAGAALAGAPFAAPAFAQGASAATPTTGTLEEVVVTARRREERLQDVPVAITALSAEAIQRANITRADELSRIAPGFSVTPAPFGNGPLAPAIRSMRQPLSNITFDQSVNTYFAEVVQARPIGLNVGLFDLANVQVLKGPQGTLFGRNSPGGALLITPKTPGREFGGYVRAIVGQYGRHDLEGAVNVPVNDMLQVRAAVRFGRRNGYANSLTTGNEIDNEHTDSYRLSIRFAPTSNFTNTIVLDHMKERDAGSFWNIREIRPGSLVATAFSGILADQQLQLANGFFSTTATTPEDANHILSWGASVISEYRINDNIKLKNIFGHRRIKAHLQFDLDGSRQPIVNGTDDLSSHQLSDEFQVVGNALDNHLDFILGVYGFKEHGTDPQVTLAFNVPAFNGLYARNKSSSVFGQATYRIPGIEGLSVTLGGRKTWDQRYMDITATRLGVCTLRSADSSTAAPLNPCFRAASANFDKFTYTSSVEYKVTPDTLVYLAHRTGYRTGGFPAAPKLPAEFIPYNPETVKDWELGLKATYHLGGMLGRTNIALYKADYNNIQRSFSFFEGTVTKSVLINAASGKIKGFEVEQTFRPIPSLEMNLNYAYSKAHYTRFVTPDGRDFTKSPFSGAPKHQVSGFVRWELPVDAEYGQVAAQFSGSYRSWSLGSDVIGFNPTTQQIIPQLVVPAYHTFDARLEWNDLMGRKGVTVAAFVKNLTNEKYTTAALLDWNTLGLQTNVLGPPRTWGVEFGYAF